MVDPHRVVQAQRLVAAPPLVAQPGMPVDDEMRDVELAQPGAQRDPALPAADDDHVGLGGPAQLLGLGLPALEPGPSAGQHPVLGAHRSPLARRFLVAGELVERGEQGERPALPQPEHAAAAADGGLELDQRGRRPASVGASVAVKPRGDAVSKVARSSSRTPSGPSRPC